MITREDEDRFSIKTSLGEIDLEFTKEGLHEYLSNIIHAGSRLWADENIARVLDFEVGEATPSPYGHYVEAE